MIYMTYQKKFLCINMTKIVPVSVSYLSVIVAVNAGNPSTARKKRKKERKKHCHK